MFGGMLAPFWWFGGCFVANRILWSLVAGFGRPGGPHNLKIGASSGFCGGFWASWGEVGGG